MRRSIWRTLGVACIAAALLTASTGCNKTLVGTHAASTVVGWLLGNAFGTGNVERQCFQNGVLIDCADLPADLGQ